jgi:hypothetical protein
MKQRSPAGYGIERYSLAQAANIPKALSEIMVAMMSTIIGVHVPRFIFPTP